MKKSTVAFIGAPAVVLVAAALYLHHRSDVNTSNSQPNTTTAADGGAKSLGIQLRPISSSTPVAAAQARVQLAVSLTSRPYHYLAQDGDAVCRTDKVEQGGAVVVRDASGLIVASTVVASATFPVLPPSELPLCEFSVVATVPASPFYTLTFGQDSPVVTLTQAQAVSGAAVTMPGCPSDGSYQNPSDPDECPFTG